MNNVALGCEVDPIEFRLRHPADPGSPEATTCIGEPGTRERKAPQQEGCGWKFGFTRHEKTSGYCVAMAQVGMKDEIRARNVRCVADIWNAGGPDGTGNRIEDGITQTVNRVTKGIAGSERAKVLAEDLAGLSCVSARFNTSRSHPSTGRKTIPLGCGGIALASIAATVGNAVRDGLGVRVRSLPISREQSSKPRQCEPKAECAP